MQLLRKNTDTSKFNTNKFSHQFFFQVSPIVDTFLTVDAPQVSSLSVKTAVYLNFSTCLVHDNCFTLEDFLQFLCCKNHWSGWL